MREWMWWIAAPLCFLAMLAGLFLVGLGAAWVIAILPDTPDRLPGGGRAIVIGAILLVGGYIVGQWAWQWRHG